MSVDCELHSPRPWSRHLHRTIGSGSHEVHNVARSVRGGPAELVLSEITGVCEMIEREMEGSSDLGLG